jgi:hypothetical protein
MEEKMKISEINRGGEKMRNTKRFFTVIGFTSAVLLLIALNGNASAKMTPNNQNPNQSARVASKPDKGQPGHSVPDESLMRPMARSLDNYRPTESLKNNDTLPKIKKDYFMRTYLTLKADTDSPLERPDGTELSPVSEGVAGRLPSPRMPAGPNGLDPAGGRLEELIAIPGLGGGEAGQESHTEYYWGVGYIRKTHLDNGHTVIHIRNDVDGYDIYEVYNERGERIHSSPHYDDDNPGYPAGGSDGVAPELSFVFTELKKKFGGESPIAIDMATGRRKGRTPRPISLADMQLLGLIVDPVTGAVRPKPKPNESGGPGATASDDDGEGTGGGLGPTGDTPGIGGPHGDGKGFASKSIKGKGIPRDPTALDTVTQPDTPCDGGGTGDNFLESHEGESPFRKLSIIDGDPRVGL